MNNGVVRFFHCSRRIFCAAVFTLCLIHAAAGQAANANTLYVPSQYPDIQTAVTATTTGDTILVADGTYTGAGNRNIDFGTKNLKIQSASGNPVACIIDCQKAGCAFILRNHQTASSTISAFTIKNGTGYQGAGGGIYLTSTDPIVSNCIFTNNTEGNGGAMYYGTAINCTFFENTAGNGGGMYGGTAANCVFVGNSASGTMTRPGNGGATVWTSLYFCTVANNTATGNGGGLSLYKNTVTNCIVWGNAAGTSGPNLYNDLTNTSTSTVTYCDIQGTVTGTGNINSDPLFVNQATGNLHLTAASPCINVGTTTVPSGFTFPATDLDGGNRVFGSAMDMGAYEYGTPGVYSITAFSGIAANALPQNVTFQFRPVGGGATINKTYFTTSDGAFYLHGIPNGSYNLWIKSDKYLAVVVPVKVNSVNPSGITATLLGGDANNDNVINIDDFGILVNAFGATGYAPTTGYDIRADFNGDGNVDIGDFGLLVNSYGDSGAN